MVLELKLRKIGNSVGVVLPKEALARLNAHEGDTVVLTETTEGGLRLTATQAGFRGRKVAVGEAHPPLPQHSASTGEMKEPVWLEDKTASRSMR